MSHIEGHKDTRLHNEDGTTHRTTAPSANGPVIYAYELAIKRHLEEHARQKRQTQVAIEDGDVEIT
jgi:hypothetical protein